MLNRRSVLTATAVLACASIAAAVATLGTYNITPASLPPPDTTHKVRNRPKQIDKPAGAELTLPPGFKASIFAEGDFKQPRGVLQASNGDVLITDSGAGSVIILRDTNQDGRADERSVFASGLNRPYGLAFWKDSLYVGNTDAVVRFKYKPGQTRSEGAAEKIADLPWAKAGHWTRSLAFSPDGRKLYVGIGSSSNVNVETDPMRATIAEFNPDGSGTRTFATGTRNPTALMFHPRSRKLWAAVQERDLIGDDLVPDFVIEVKDGGFYGWPYAYAGPNEDPRRKGEQPDLVRKTLAPDVLIQAHSAVLGAAFGAGTMFPQDYRDDLYAALHGSWNRAERTGYKIIRIPFKGDRAAGGYEDFVVGWMLDPGKPEVWGRPVGVAFLEDGSMLITDDGANKVWRVTYGK